MPLPLPVRAEGLFGFELVGLGTSPCRPINHIDPDGRIVQVLLAQVAIRAAIVAGRYLLESAAAAAIGYGLNELLDYCIDQARGKGKDGPAPPAGPMTDDQEALKDAVDEQTLGGRKPLPAEDAETVLDWGDETGYPGIRAKPGDVADPSNWGSVGIPHIHVPGAGRGGHVPVEPGVNPR